MGQFCKWYTAESVHEMSINGSENVLVYLPLCRFVRLSGQPVGHGELSRIAAGEECNSISIKIRRRV